MNADKDIVPLVVSLLVCWFACNLSADTPPIRISVQVNRDDADSARLVSALSREFGKLDGVTVDGMQPALTIHCVVVDMHQLPPKGYVASVAIVMADGHLMTQVNTGATVDALAHEIAITLDGSVIQQMRRAAQPSPTPTPRITSPNRLRINDSCMLYGLRRFVIEYG